MKLYWQIFFRNADGAGAGGGDGGAGDPKPAGSVAAEGGLAAAAAAAQAAAAPAAAAAPGAAGSIYHPEGLDKAFAGKTERETLDNLAKHVAGLPKPPEKADAYTLTLPKDLEGAIDVKNDKVLPIFRQVAHELGLTQPQFEGTITKLYGAMAKAGLMMPSVDVSKEFTALGGKDGTPAEQMQAGQVRVMAVADSVKALVTKQVLSSDEGAGLIKGMTTAHQIVAVEKLVKAAGGGSSGPQPGGGKPEMTDHEKGLRTMYPSMFKE